MSKYLVFYGKNYYFAKLNYTKQFIMKGKKICKALKEIRLNIAKSNDIDYIPAECNHKGDCSGTCPQCEKEMRYIEQQLLRRQTLGKAAVVAGLALGATSIAPAMAQTYHNVPKVEQSKEELKPVDDEKGKITKLGTATDYYGQFAIRVSKGSKVQIRYIGCKIVTKKFNKPEENLVIKLKDKDMQLTGEVVIVKQKTMPDVDSDIYEMR